MTYTLAFVLGPWEIAVIALICILVFGKRLPKIMSHAAKGIKGFQSEIRSTKQEIAEAGKQPQRLCGEGASGGQNDSESPPASQKVAVST